MSVNAIGGITSTTDLDWRKLTAKQILKYQQEGYQIPDVYVAWAVAFIQNISDSDQDVTTYEMSKGMTGGKGDTKNPAHYLNLTSTEALTVKNLDKALENSADKLEDSAESYIDTASNIKDTIDDIMSDESMIGKMGLLNSYHARLRSIGSQGQSMIAGKIAEFDNYENLIKQYYPDAVTGLNLARSLSGDMKENLTKSSSALKENIKTGQDAVHEGKNDASGYRQELGAESGVFQAKSGTVQPAGSGGNVSSDGGGAGANTGNSGSGSGGGVKPVTSSALSDVSGTKSIAESTNKKLNEDKSNKSVKAAQNDGNDKNDKLHTDLNAIMQYKIRTGKINTNDTA